MATAASVEVEGLDAAAVRAIMMQPSVKVIDVRLPFDYFGGRVPGSLNLPGLLVLERKGEMSSDTRLVFVCDDGSESAETAAAAKAAGFGDVAVLEGGLDAWLDADFPVETISDGVGTRERT